MLTWVIGKISTLYPTVMGDLKDNNGKQTKSASKKKAESTSKPAKQDDKEGAECVKKAQLEIKMRERVASEARAFDVVNRLIESGITEDYLLLACQLIDNSHYGDVVEERSITHVCGYPLCDNPLQQVTKKIAKKKYQISTRTNTVYDITERKKYCSSRCYHASQHLHKQIPETPVWTRRGESLDPFDLLPHDVKPLQGEEVIGSKMFDLREEVMLLKKLDRKEEETAKSRKIRSAKDGRASLEESKRLSDQLLSLSTEEDLNKGMGKLCLSREDGDSQQSGEALSGSPTCSEMEGKRPKEHSNAEEGSGGEHELDEKTEKGNRANIETEVVSSMRDLSLKDQGDVNSVDSDDDDGCSEHVGDGDVGTSKKQKSDISCETQDSSVTKTCTGLPNLVKADSDDDEDGDVGSTRRSENLSEIQCSNDSGACTDCSHQVGTDSKGASIVSDSFQVDKKPKDSALKQQPGESKSAYLMRLLDKRKNMLSKVVDIQSHPTDNVQNSEPKTDNFPDKNVVASKVVEMKPSESGRNEGLKEVDWHHGDSSEKSEQTLDPEATLTSAKKSTPRLTQTCKKSSNQSAASPETKVCPLSSVCQIISSWVSPDTLAFLGLILDKTEGNAGGENESADMFHKDPEMQRKYQNLCQRLAGQEKDFDDVLGEEEIEDEEDKRRASKPMPHYKELKRQADEYQLRVQQFLGGSSFTKSKPTKVDGEGDKEKTDIDRPIVLPAVDSHNQLLIRRRIVLERLDRTMPSLLPPLGLSIQDISGSLRELVFTFSLTSQNIVFKPMEWTLVAIILLIIVISVVRMEERCAVVRGAFQSADRTSAFDMVLSRLGHSIASLGQLVQDMLIQHRQDLQELPD